MGRVANSGTFKKGHGGTKPKGAENKTSKKAKELFVSILEGQIDYIQEAFDAVRKEDPGKYLDLFAKYAKYFVPAQIKIENPVEFTIKSFSILPNDKGNKD